MKRSARFARGVLLLGVSGVIALGALAAVASAARPPGGGCICPAVYDPVLCPNGRTYSNGCVAACHGQTGCTRIGGI